MLYGYEGCTPAAVNGPTLRHLAISSLPLPPPPYHLSRPCLMVYGAALSKWSSETELRERELALLERLSSPPELGNVERQQVEAELASVRAELRATGANVDENWLVEPEYIAPPQRSNLSPLSRLPPRTSPATLRSQRVAAKTSSRSATLSKVADYFASRPEDSTMGWDSALGGSQSAVPTFEAIDHNGDGTISRKEYEQQVESVSHAAPRFQDIDTDGDGTITREEYERSSSIAAAPVLSTAALDSARLESSRNSFVVTEETQRSMYSTKNSATPRGTDLEARRRQLQQLKERRKASEQRLKNMVGGNTSVV